MMQNVFAAWGVPFSPSHSEIAPLTRWMMLWARERCAPRRPGTTNPAAPTRRNTIPRIVAILLAMSNAPYVGEWSLLPRDPAAAETEIVLVEDDGLPWSNAAQFLRKRHASTVAVERSHRC